MKKPIFLILLALWSFTALSQNYQCFRNDGAIRWFIDNVNYLRGIRIDSVVVSGTDTIYYPYKTYRGGSPGPSWLGGRITQQTDGTFLFPNAYNDTVIIHTQATLGDTWVFYSDSGSKYYTATVTGIDTMTILGGLDSIKIMRINAWTSALDTLDSLNNFTLTISQHNGFVRVFDLYNFPYHSWGSSATDCGDAYFGLVNATGISSQVFNVVPFHIPTQIEMYDWHVADVFIYGTTEGCCIYTPLYPGSYETEYDSVLYRNDVDPYLTKITVKHIRNAEYAYCYPYPPPPSYSADDWIDTVRLDSSLAFSMYKIPEEDGQYLSYYFYPADSTPCHQQDRIYSSIAFPFEGCIRRRWFGIGAGVLDTESCTTCSPDGPDYTTYEVKLLYSIKNGIPCGTRVDVATPEIISHQFAISIYPNPATAQLTIDIPDNANVYSYYLTNTLGQQVSAGQLTDTKTVLDVNGLPSGVYYISVISGSQQRYYDKVVIMH